MTDDWEAFRDANGTICKLGISCVKHSRCNLSGAGMRPESRTLAAPFTRRTLFMSRSRRHLTYKDVHIYIYIYVYVYACAHVYTCQCICVCVCVYIYIYIYIHIYIYIYKNTREIIHQDTHTRTQSHENTRTHTHTHAHTHSYTLTHTHTHTPAHTHTHTHTHTHIHTHARPPRCQAQRQPGRAKDEALKVPHILPHVDKTSGRQSPTEHLYTTIKFDRSPS